MRVGVRFCGGCNPHFNRKAVLDDLISCCQGIAFDAYRTEERYDGVLLMCGCTRCQDSLLRQEAHRKVYLVTSVRTAAVVAQTLAKEEKTCQR